MTFFLKPQVALWVRVLVSFRVQDPSKYTQDELHLMKTQDLRYVLNKAQAEDRVSTRTLSLSHCQFENQF